MVRVCGSGIGVAQIVSVRHVVVETQVMWKRGRWTLVGMFVLSLFVWHGRSFATDPLSSAGLTMEANASQTVLQSGQRQLAWIRVGITSPRPGRKLQRPLVNLAVVIDRSGSMQGNKIAYTREAIIGALNLLSPDDIITVVAYDSDVNVVVPATKMADKDDVVEAIRAIQPGGNTALFAGVSKAAAELRKFKDPRRVNRIIVLSDGLANVGPSAPGELASLGASLRKENITVSTMGLGLGYHEDLMLELAAHSGGNHHFVQQERNLAQAFQQEFSDLLSVMAQEIDIRVQVPGEVVPTRVLGNVADINGQSVVSRISQIYAGQTRSVLIEVEIPSEFARSEEEAGHPAQKLLANVEVTYRDMVSGQQERMPGQVEVQFSEDSAAIQKSLNNPVMADVVYLFGNEQNKMATQLLDQGDVEGCRAMLIRNRQFLAAYAEELQCQKLEESARLNSLQLDALNGVKSSDAPAALISRKGMRERQFRADQQLNDQP